MVGVVRFHSSLWRWAVNACFTRCYAIDIWICEYEKIHILCLSYQPQQQGEITTLWYIVLLVCGICYFLCFYIFYKYIDCNVQNMYLHVWNKAINEWIKWIILGRIPMMDDYLMCYNVCLTLFFSRFEISHIYRIYNILALGCYIGYIYCIQDNFPYICVALTLCSLRFASTKMCYYWWSC